MSFLFGLCDFLLAGIMLFDTLGLIYQFRKEPSSVNEKEYIRVCFSWILFLGIWTLFSCSWKGFFGTLIRLIFLIAKMFVTIPKLGGTNKIHKFLVVDGKGEEYFKKVVELVKSKCCKGCPCTKGDEQVPSSRFEAETVEPESPGIGD